MIKFVIWGAGFRGKNILAYIGEERIVAFIDKSLNMQGKYINNVPIISYEEYKERYAHVPVIISPILYLDEIREVLERDGIVYFSGYVLPPQIIENPNVKKIKEFQSHILKEVSCLEVVPIWGINIYSILIYELLQKEGICTYIVRENNSDRVYQVLVDSGYLIKNSLQHKIVCITDRENIDSVPEKKHVKLYDLKKYYINSEITKYKNIHSGERCFIVATGPSLTLEDLEKLHANNEICISMNGIFKLYNQTAWRPNYFLIEDNKGFDEWKSEIIKYADEVTTFVADWCNIDTVPNDKINVYHLAKHMISEQQKPHFSEDFSMECFWSSTVSYECLQLAYYMGFKEIIFIGLDFNYSFQFNHFSNDYHSSEKEGIMDHSKELKKMALGFSVANEFAKQHGIKILNASRQSCLEIFEKVDFDMLF